MMGGRSFCSSALKVGAGRGLGTIRKFAVAGSNSGAYREMSAGRHISRNMKHSGREHVLAGALMGLLADFVIDFIYECVVALLWELPDANDRKGKFRSRAGRPDGGQWAI